MTFERSLVTGPQAVDATRRARVTVRSLEPAHLAVFRGFADTLHALVLRTAACRAGGDPERRA